MKYEGEDKCLSPGEAKVFATGLKLHLPPSVVAVLTPYPQLAARMVLMPDSPRVLSRQVPPEEILIRRVNVGEKDVWIYGGNTIALITFHRSPRVDLRVSSYSESPVDEARRYGGNAALYL